MAGSPVYLDLASDFHSRLALVFTKRFSHLYHRLSPNILREAIAYLDIGPLLPFIKGSTLSLYNLQVNREVKVQLTAAFPRLTRCCLTSPLEVLIFPNDSSDVWEYNIQSHLLRALPSLSTSRDWPCLVYYSLQMYVFGGYRKVTNERLETNVWNDLAHSSMNHFQSNPCPVLQRIYLCDRKLWNGSLEYYDIAANSFSTIKPLVYMELSSALTFAEGETLVWLTHSGTCVRQHPNKTIEQELLDESDFLLPVLCPVTFRDCFYWRQMDGTVRHWQSPYLANIAR